MEALKWLCVTMVVLLCAQEMVKLSSANRSCRDKCKEENERKAACPENCNRNRTDYYLCIYKCPSFNIMDCVNRCLRSMDAGIKTNCSKKCRIEGTPPEILDIVTAVMGHDLFPEESEQEKCYRDCYTKLLEHATNKPSKRGADN